jgi:phosphate transport system substrate-binding protein
MKKIHRRSFLKIMGAAGCAAALAACGAAADSTGPAASAAALSGKVSTGGSTSMEKVMSALMEGFSELWPEVDVTYDPTGSGAGITGARNGTLDIGLSSRKLHDDEAGVTATTIALDGIAIVVNSANKIADLSIEQIASIFKGETTNWKDLGGEDSEIVVIGREAGSGTRDGFESIIDVKDACRYVQELTATGAVISAVAGNAAAVGYASLSALDGTVNAVTVAGVTCSEETVLDGTYTIQRPFNFVTKASAALSDAAQAFVDFAVSADASELIRSAGAVPMV